MSSNIPFFLECTTHFSEPNSRELYLRLYDRSVVLHGYGLQPGFDAVRAHYQLLWTGIPDIALRIDDVFEAGDKLACRFACLGTHLGQFKGIEPTGRRIEYGGITILHFANGRCIERWSQTDRAALMQQLGAG